MPPRHFWWLVETLDDGAKSKRGGGALSEQDKAQMLRMIQDAKEGKL